jgi:hypothetical protein
MGITGDVVMGRMWAAADRNNLGRKKEPQGGGRWRKPGHGGSWEKTRYEPFRCAAPVPRACLLRWLVGSAAPLRGHIRVWPHFALPQPGLPEPKRASRPGYGHMPNFTVAGELGSAERKAADSGAVLNYWPGFKWRANTI